MAARDSFQSDSVHVVGAGCFRCTKCKLAISGGSSLVEKDGRPYHPWCHKELHHPKCSVCNDYLPEEVRKPWIDNLGCPGRISWHDHFRVTYMELPLHLCNCIFHKPAGSAELELCKFHLSSPIGKLFKRHDLRPHRWRVSIQLNH